MTGDCCTAWPGESQDPYFLSEHKKRHPGFGSSTLLIPVAIIFMDLKTAVTSLNKLTEVESDKINVVFALSFTGRRPNHRKIQW